ncbi:TTL-domain-containing protein [Heliocybe sulcata]|uniref:TTL-domain-containing protein n=1 Tax=Heliocybe sulcata TaxID=5364 RepID=A0A5C3NKA1_9AGAM|nr:TTL-domain-containing protein [Heliocybe sulcata]
MNSLTAVIEWPSAPLTHRLVSDTLDKLSVPPESRLSGSLPGGASPDGRILQWQSYDHINHHLTLSQPANVFSSSYTIRKSLIRKHYLSRCISSYLTKHPGASTLRAGAPRTWEVEISWSDEMDEKWADELWDLGETLEANEGREEEDKKWFILKPGMADRGNGIRIFDSKEALQDIFEEWDDSDDEGDGDNADSDSREDTGIVTSQLRHFVIQEYLSNPLLMDPTEKPLDPLTPPPQHHLEGHKAYDQFHLRAYILARGALQVYLFTHILALFASAPYRPPSHSNKEGNIDLTPHLTNTCLQPDHSEAHVRTLDELIGCTVLSSPDSDTRNFLSREDVESIKTRMGEILADVFKAALENPIHFQPLPNAFELFGVDFLLSHSSASTPSNTPPPECPYTVSLLELNAEPAIEMTGQRLHWLLQGLFTGIGEVAVRPWLEGREHEPEKSEKWGMRKVLDVQVRGGW